MTKKKLTIQQKKRIKEKQRTTVEQKLALGKENLAQVISVQRKQALVKRDKEILSVNLRKNIGPVVCGDNVALELTDNNEYVAVGILPRKTELSRTNAYHKKKLVAANINLVIIVVAITPEPSFELLDRYLLACEVNQIPVIIIQNKIDLHNLVPANLELQEKIFYYREIGYNTLQTSAISKQGLNNLSDVLIDKLATIVGQSGVGKSSITQKLVPEEDIQIGAVSESMHGRHTTSTSYLYDLPKGGQLIDTPGIRNFISGDFDFNELVNGFIEFKPFLGNCKFHDCTHIQEPNCAIRAAVAENKISKSRFDSYCKILSSTT